MKKSILFALLLLFPVVCFAQETLTISTYYPSPYGSYNELQVGNLKIGNNNTNTTLNGVVNFWPQARPATGNNGDLYFNNSGKFEYYYSGWNDFGGAVYNLADVDVYTAAGSGLGWTILANISGSGVLLGGSVSGHLLDKIEIVVDGSTTKTIDVPLREVEGPGGNDFGEASIPGPIRFSTSLRIRFNDSQQASDITSGVAYVVD